MLTTPALSLATDPATCVTTRRGLMRKCGKAYGYASFAGNIPTNPKRTEEINQRLRDLVKIATRPMTFAEIAEYCGMSKQAVYQIEKSAFMKIRKKHPGLLKEIEDCKYELPYLSCYQNESR